MALLSSSSAAKQLILSGHLSTLLPLWEAASKQLQAVITRSHSSDASSNLCRTECVQQQGTLQVARNDHRQLLQQHKHLYDQHQHQQPHEQQEQQQQQQQLGMPGWLQQLAGSSRQERLSALSRLTISFQDKLAAAAPSVLSQAAMAAVATAATAAAAPAGASLASFQGTRYTGSNSLSAPGMYWLRQMGMEHGRATALLVAANVLSFGMQQVSTTWTGYCVRVGYKVAQGEYWRLLSAAFVHGNVLHVGINMLALWNIGRMVEPQLGSSRFLAVYLGSAISGNLLGYWMSTGFAASMGSSSALTGLLGAFLASSWVNRHSVFTSRAQVVSVLQTIGINLALMTIFGGHMDNWAHLGGFLGGGVIGAVVAPRYSR